MKKGFITMLIVLILSTSVIFAGGVSEESSVNDDKGSTQVKELSFWHYFTGAEGEIFEEYIDTFNKLNEGKIHIDAEFVPREELMKQYTIGAVSGELPDMGMVDNPDHASYASMGILQDITDLYNSWDGANFLDGPLNSCIYDGKIYGVPQASNCLALFYDRDLLKEFNLEIPKTWSELENASRILTDHSIGRYGLAISAIGNEEGTFQFIPFLESSGKFDELDSAGSIESLEFLTGMVNKGYMSKEIINWNQADAEKQFASGSAALMVNGPWNIASVNTDAPDKNWGVDLVPRADNGVNASCLGGENFVICKGADREACWEFLSWFCGKENSQQYNFDINKFSPRADVDGSVVYAADPQMALFASVMPTAKPRGPHPRWPEISAAIYTAEQEALTGQKTPKEAMIDAQKKVDKINSENY